MDETVPNPEELTPQPRDSPEPKSPKLSESQVDGMVEDKTEEDELEDEKPKTDEPTVIADAAAKDEDATKPSDSSPDPEDPSEADSKPPLSKASSAESAAGASASADTTDSNDIYQVKWIVFKNRKQVPIITQNANGPCPLLAIANVLLLQGKINLADGVEAISAEQLLGYLGKSEKSLSKETVLSISFMNYYFRRIHVQRFEPEYQSRTTSRLRSQRERRCGTFAKVVDRDRRQC